ncbi:MAG: translation elongation factor Ts [Candidatus Harrisonbacteria bacterium CG10_big_fil_rev_8_21_14_0_10_44_23]|uniref:Elongation factor Ts n=1 Tax=Candidatus Harrisonbacteria bacterium CG10_big_fil_rev_8_21_14_0_10_44_23 TaxID=1974585 RepID=A0A2H0UQ24_9BACT|nr:MAG: translation elongation factor Ts [Candidatus Harrisonbacteria bacterium CG10_big_fil_rev_8_21_14_0_10_44_23]
MSQDIQKLREETGAGVMDCKRALEEAGGDIEKAKEVIKAQGLAKAEKKGERNAGAGYLEAYIHQGRVGVLLKMNAETDFVTKNEKFQELSRNIAMHIAAMNPASVEELLAQPYVRDESTTIEEQIKQVIGTIGENITVGEFTRYEA